jgi:hypothetical protein
LIEKDASHVLAWAIYAFDQSIANRVSADSKHHGHHIARKLRRPRGGDISGGGDHDYAHGYKFSRKGRQCAIVPASPPFLNTDIAAFDKASLGQAFSKRVSIETIGIRRSAVQEPYQGHRSLRQCAERQRRCCAAYDCDELPPSHPCPLKARRA